MCQLILGELVGTGDFHCTFNSLAFCFTAASVAGPHTPSSANPRSFCNHFVNHARSYICTCGRSHVISLSSPSARACSRSASHPGYSLELGLEQQKQTNKHKMHQSEKMAGGQLHVRRAGENARVRAHVGVKVVLDTRREGTCRHALDAPFPSREFRYEINGGPVTMPTR